MYTYILHYIYLTWNVYLYIIDYGAGLSIMLLLGISDVDFVVLCTYCPYYYYISGSLFICSVSVISSIIGSLL